MEGGLEEKERRIKGERQRRRRDWNGKEREMGMIEREGMDRGW